jgi:hypothetical protein
MSQVQPLHPPLAGAVAAGIQYGRLRLLDNLSNCSINLL